MRALSWLSGMVIVASACGVAQARQPSEASVLYGQLTAAQRAEVFQWGQAYWEHVETGAVSTFVFSDPLMNSHLFNPLRSTRATLERLKLWEATDCDRIITAATREDAALWEKRTRLKESMTDGKFVTDAVENPAGTQEHIDKVFVGAAGSPVTAYFDGAKLVSNGAALDTVEMTPGLTFGSGDLGMHPSPTAAIFSIQADLVAQAPILAAACTNRTEAQKLVTGLPSRADELELALQARLVTLGSAPLTQRYDAAFGVYGSQPIIVAYFEDACILIDGITGAWLGGPLQPGIAINPFAGMRWGDVSRAFNSFGCEIKYTAVKEPWSPAPSDTITLVPGLPGLAPTSYPGRPSLSACTHTPTPAPGSCTCVVERSVLVNPCPAGVTPHPTLGCVVREVISCAWSPVPLAGCTSPPSINSPVQPYPGPWPVPGATCTTTYYYWK